MNWYLVHQGKPPTKMSSCSHFLRINSSPQLRKHRIRGIDVTRELLPKSSLTMKLEIDPLPCKSDEKSVIGAGLPPLNEHQQPT